MGGKKGGGGRGEEKGRGREGKGDVLQLELPTSSDGSCQSATECHQLGDRASVRPFNNSPNYYLKCTKWYCVIHLQLEILRLHVDV